MWRLKGVIFQFSAQLPNCPLIYFLAKPTFILSPSPFLFMHTYRYPGLHYHRGVTSHGPSKAKVVKATTGFSRSPAGADLAGSLCLFCRLGGFLTSMAVSQAEKKCIWWEFLLFILLVWTPNIFHLSHLKALVTLYLETTLLFWIGGCGQITEARGQPWKEFILKHN